MLGNYGDYNDVREKIIIKKKRKQINTGVGGVGGLSSLNNGIYPVGVIILFATFVWSNFSILKN